MMTNTDKVKFLEHISCCDYCADQFTTLMSENIITAPRDMKATILKATKRPDVQIVAKARETSKKMQLLIYSLKVCTATVCALMLLVLTMNLPSITNTMHPIGNVSTQKVAVKINDQSLTTAIRDGVDNINNNMLEFSNNIMNGGNK